MKPTTVAQRALAWTLVWTLTVQPFVSAMAAGVQVAGSNTSLDNAGNGVPVVNIAQPNGAGFRIILINSLTWVKRDSSSTIALAN